MKLSLEHILFISSALSLFIYSLQQWADFQACLSSADPPKTSYKSFNVKCSTSRFSQFFWSFIQYCVIGIEILIFVAWVQFHWLSLESTTALVIRWNVEKTLLYKTGILSSHLWNHRSIVLRSTSMPLSLDDKSDLSSIRSLRATTGNIKPSWRMNLLKTYKRFLINLNMHM